MYASYRCSTPCCAFQSSRARGLLIFLTVTPLWQAMDTRATSPLFPHEERRKAEVNQFGSVGSDPHPIELLEARICGAVAAQSHRSGRCRFSRSLPLLRTPYTRDLVTIWSLPLSFGKLTLVENFLTLVAFLYQACSGSCNSILCFSVLEKGFTKRVQSCRQCRFICGDQYYYLRLHVCVCIGV